ncbi:hypothetical protein NDU88_006306 [Pleurodeles waltl]|uniref:Uncharacterized protein n=1 Tax=Pleurodeles waltl TaxID=8319 RepID=A0AAV7PI25_PLEWA|nr:hypothetical protein NDU88_006306 [Pleurodeles waltl]
MPRGKTAGKISGKPARQLLFSEALRQQKHPSAEVPLSSPCSSMADATQGTTMDGIPQEISAVSRKLEGMDSAMVALTAETRSMRLDIAGFQSQIPGLDQRMATVETQVASWTDRDQELLLLRSKVMDLEDRNNVRLLGFPEGIAGTDLFSYLRETLPKLTENSKGLTGWAPTDKRGAAAPSYYSLLAATHAGSPTATGSQNAWPIQIGCPGNPAFS